MNNNNIQKIPEKAVPARQTQTGPGTPAARPGKAAPALPQQKPSGKAVPAPPPQKPSGKIDEESANIPGLVPSQEDHRPRDQKKKKGRTTRNPLLGQPGEASVHSWFFTLMCMNVPIAGWIYLFYLAFNRKNTSRRNFARAYVLYKLLFFLLSAALLAALVYAGMQVADKVLAYMEML